MVKSLFATLSLIFSILPILSHASAKNFYLAPVRLVKPSEKFRATVISSEHKNLISIVKVQVSLEICNASQVTHKVSANYHQLGLNSFFLEVNEVRDPTITYITSTCYVVPLDIALELPVPLGTSQINLALITAEGDLLYHTLNVSLKNQDKHQSSIPLACAQVLSQQQQ